MVKKGNEERIRLCRAHPHSRGKNYPQSGERANDSAQAGERIARYEKRGKGDYIYWEKSATRNSCRSAFRTTSVSPRVRQRMIVRYFEIFSLLFKKNLLLSRYTFSRFTFGFLFHEIFTNISYILNSIRDTYFSELFLFLF